jgi:BESS motif
MEELMPSPDQHSVVSWLSHKEMQNTGYTFDFEQEQEMDFDDNLEPVFDPDSHVQDPDKLFLLHLLHDIKDLDPKTRSFFKSQTQTLLHQLKYGEM